MLLLASCLDPRRIPCNDSNMLEVEMKFPVPSVEPVVSRIQQLGATLTKTLHESDQYFNAPDRDFAKTDEALRIRRIGAEHALVTYKGPKRDAQTKTRAEIEVPLGSGEQNVDAFSRLLVCLGYRPVAAVSKDRRIYVLKRDGFTLEVCLDRVAEVGEFVELEIQAPEEQLNAARQVLLQVAAELELRDSERRSYLELLLTTRARKP
jgi:adenylate cyclase, class 2